MDGASEYRGLSRFVRCAARVAPARRDSSQPEDFANVRGLRIHISLAVVREARCEDPLQGGEAPCGSGMCPQVFPQSDIVAP